MEGSTNVGLEFAGRFDTGLKLRSRQPRIADQYMDLSFSVSLQSIPPRNLLDAPSTNSSSGSRFRLGTSKQPFWRRAGRPFSHPLMSPLVSKSLLGIRPISKGLADFMPCPGQWPCSCRCSLAGAWLWAIPLRAQAHPSLASPACGVSVRERTIVHCLLLLSDVGPSHTSITLFSGSTLCGGAVSAEEPWKASLPGFQPPHAGWDSGSWKSNLHKRARKPF